MVETTEGKNTVASFWTNPFPTSSPHTASIINVLALAILHIGFNVMSFEERFLLLKTFKTTKLDVSFQINNLHFVSMLRGSNQVTGKCYSFSSLVVFPAVLCSETRNPTRLPLRIGLIIGSRHSKWV